MRTHAVLLSLLPCLALALAPPLLAAEAPAVGCDPGGLATLLSPGRVLLLGEIHGGVEGPALLAAAACAATRAGLAVTVALEIPAEEGPRIDRFLASPGAAGDRDALLAGDFWRRDYQDGRSSEAMLHLLDDVRRLAAESRRVRVSLLDSAEPFTDGQLRDDLMGRRLAGAVEAAGVEGLVLALAGNIHTRTRAGVPWNAAYRPAATVVAQRWPRRTIALLLAGPDGEAWMCTTAEVSSCGVRPIHGKPVEAPGSVELYPVPRDGYDGTIRLDAATASPPATRSAARPPS